LFCQLQSGEVQPFDSNGNLDVSIAKREAGLGDSLSMGEFWFDFFSLPKTELSICPAVANKQLLAIK
jgi:hypothetical protein